MPVNYKLYHPMWHRISRFVRLIRAQNQCEQCGIRNYTVIGYLDKQVESTQPFDDYPEARRFADERNRRYVYVSGKGQRWAVVVLTVAHLDHNIANNDLENLKCLCQRCHFSHDRRDNVVRRRYGRTGRFFGQIRLNLR